MDDKAHQVNAFDFRIPWLNLIRDFLIFTLKLYRKYISPFKPPSCRFTPTCSEYSILALEKYGLFKGTAKSVWRVLRCNPLSKGGYDPP